MHRSTHANSGLFKKSEPVDQPTKPVFNYMEQQEDLVLIGPESSVVDVNASDEEIAIRTILRNISNLRAEVRVLREKNADLTADNSRLQKEIDKLSEQEAKYAKIAALLSELK